MINLIIDNREIEIINRLNNISCINFKKEQLDLGDILFKKNDETILIIERKTIKDLKASICDGRHKEQKLRLISNVPIERIIYLIEGSFDYSLNYSINGIPIDTLIGSLINTQLRDNIKVYKTQSIDESVNFLIKLYNKITKDIDIFFKQISNPGKVEYSNSLKKNKQANMTPNLWFLYILSSIPQLSEKIAEEIIKIYPSLPILIKEYENTPERLKLKLLSDIKIETKNGSRRIGDKMSEKIYNFIFCVETKSDN